MRQPSSRCATSPTRRPTRNTWSSRASARVERAETRAFQAGEDDDLIDTFRCVLRAVPRRTPFRLPNMTPRPLIRGPQTARVAGESGQEITTDQYGRIKVKFPWDRRTTEDENSSCWIRVAQSWAGQGWGAMFIPRIGQEVVVEFLEGNPDRPLVTGQVYNADMTVPYALPDNKTRSTIKSNSSLNGGGFNEFRFEDKKGSEEVFFQAQKDFNEVILNIAHLEDHPGHDHHDRQGQARRHAEHRQRHAHRISNRRRPGQRSPSQGNAPAAATADDDGHRRSPSKSPATRSSSTTTAITLTVGGNSIELGPSGITLQGHQDRGQRGLVGGDVGSTAKVAGSTDLALDGGAHAALKAALVEIN